MKRAIFTLILLAAQPATAFTPESGWWWNPNESGRGYNIEIQDNVAVISTYVFEESGDPIWFLAAGTVRGYGGSGEPAPYVRTQLDGYSGGQCITCPYDGKPVPDEGQAGEFRIDFTSRTTGVITWRDDSTTPIRRFEFGWNGERQKMLGEWRMVVDFSSQTEDGLAFWSGDALQFDAIRTDSQGDYYAGFRVKSRYAQTGDVNDLGDAAGNYIEPSSSAPGSPGVHTIIVDNSGDPEERWLAYYVTVGTDRLTGVAEVYCDEQVLDDCGPTGRGVPVEGWRNASRKFAQGGNGPAKAAGAAAADGQTGIRMPASFSAVHGVVGGKSVAELTGDAKLASRAVAAARRLTEQLRAKQ